MGGDNKGAVCLGVVLQEELVEPLPHHHIQPGHRFVQNGDVRSAGQSQQDGHHGHLPLGQLGNFLLRVELELLEQSLGILLVPVGVEDRGGVQVILDLQVVGAGKQGGLELPGEADVVESVLVFPHGLAVVGHLAAVHGVLGGEDGQQGGFARSVAADEAVDLARLDVQIQVLEHLVVAIGLAHALGR